MARKRKARKSRKLSRKNPVTKARKARSKSRKNPIAKKRKTRRRKTRSNPCGCGMANCDCAAPAKRKKARRARKARKSSRKSRKNPAKAAGLCKGRGCKTKIKRKKGPGRPRKYCRPCAK